MRLIGLAVVFAVSLFVAPFLLAPDRSCRWVSDGPSSRHLRSDGKWTEASRGVLEGVRVVLAPFRAPNANVYAE
jgi:hypothetical protein